MAPAPILTLTDISLRLGGNPLFSDLSVSLHPGERLALVGRNGAGKSTLLRVMAGMVQPDAGERFVQPGCSIAMMEQDPDFSGFATLGDFVRVAVPEGEEYRAQIALEGVGLDGDTPAEGASGGERRRAALARLIAGDADLLLLDEPTNHLDIAMIDWLEQTLAASRKAFVLISHDRAFLRNLTRATLWVDRGQVRRLDKGFEHFEDWRDTVFSEEDQQRHKLNRLIKAEARWAVEGISARRKRNQGRVRRLAELRSERAGQISRQGPARMALDSGQKSGKLVAEADGISKSLGGRLLVNNLSLRVQRGERVALIGPNGAGKTTLLRLLTGALPPDTGTIRLGSNLSVAELDQTRAQLNPDASLWDNLTLDPELGARGQGDHVMVRGVSRHVVGYLKDFLFDETQARAPVHALSGGERARLLLARIMARESNLLVLDEPTNDLDVETLDLLQELIDDYDGTVLLVSHDRDFLDRVATTSLLMEGDGLVHVYAGGWSDMLAQRKAAGLGLPEALVSPDRREGSGGRRASARKTAQGGPAKPAVRAQAASVASALSFTERHRLETLPARIAQLESDIARLGGLLADPDLFARDPAKFDKASAAMAARQQALAEAEEDWLDLAARAEG